MARKVDAEADFASKAILDQLQTKTVGAPPSSTGLTGDQLPETIFDVNDFDTVKNQVTLQPVSYTHLTLPTICSV